MTKYEIYPLPMSRITISAGYMTYFMNYDEMIDATIYSWYIKGAGKNIIVDTGCPIETIRQHRPNCKEIRTFEDALKTVDLTPEMIDVVIQTQLHYDHCGNTYKCKNAEIIVQKKELQFGLAPHPVMAGLYDKEMFSRLKFNIVNGDTEVDKGIHLLFVPGHSPGTQAVAVNTAEGTAIISGFCCTMDTFVMPKKISGYTVKGVDQLEIMWPVRTPGIHVDPLQAFDSALRVKGLADIIIPQHDPMFEKIKRIPEKYNTQKGVRVV